MFGPSKAEAVDDVASVALPKLRALVENVRMAPYALWLIGISCGASPAALVEPAAPPRSRPLRAR